jgi:hypothetical protein
VATEKKLSGLEQAKAMLAKNKGKKPSLSEVVSAQREANAQLRLPQQETFDVEPVNESDALVEARRVMSLPESEREEAFRKLEDKDQEFFEEVLAAVPQLSGGPSVDDKPAGKASKPVVYLDLDSPPELRTVLTVLAPGGQLTVKQVRTAADTGLLTRALLDQLVQAGLVDTVWSHGRGVYEITQAGAEHVG